MWIEVEQAESAVRESVLEILRINHADLKRFGVRGIALFGSYARGDTGPRSDVNLLVDLEPGTTLFGFVRLRNHLQDLLGIPVSLTTADALRPALRGQILAEAIHVA
jgi:predicted nucleotidyltransferase